MIKRKLLIGLSAAVLFLGGIAALVSLPASAYKGEEGEDPEPYEYTVDGHPLAGAVLARGAAR